jgi:hypothetical protein
MIPAIPPLQPCHQMKKLILGWFPQKLLVFHCRKLLEIKCRKLLVFTCRLQLRNTFNTLKSCKLTAFSTISTPYKYHSFKKKKG